MTHKLVLGLGVAVAASAVLALVAACSSGTSGATGDAEGGSDDAGIDPGPCPVLEFPSTCPTPPPSWKNEVEPLIAGFCEQCHGPGGQAAEPGGPQHLRPRGGQPDAVLAADRDVPHAQPGRLAAAAPLSDARAASDDGDLAGHLQRAGQLTDEPGKCHADTTRSLRASWSERCRWASPEEAAEAPDGEVVGQRAGERRLRGPLEELELVASRREPRQRPLARAAPRRCCASTQCCGSRADGLGEQAFIAARSPRRAAMHAR